MTTLKADNDDESSQSGIGYDDTEQPEGNDNVVDNKEEGLDLAKNEDKWVVCLRIFTALLLILVALTVCLGVYFEGRHSEKQDFETGFEDLASKLVSSFGDVVEQRFGVIQSFGEDITSQADGAWPLVTPRDYIHRTEVIVRLANLIFLVFFPIVTRDKVEAWENYANETKGWREEVFAISQGVPLEEVQLPPFMSKIMDIENADGPVPAVTTSDGPYAPLWTAYPAYLAVAANADFHSDVEHRGPIDNTIATGNPTFEGAYSYVGREKDERYELFKSLPYIGYQGDAFSVAFFPSKLQLPQSNRKSTSDLTQYSSQSLIVLKRTKKWKVSCLSLFIGEPILRVYCPLVPME